MPNGIKDDESKTYKHYPALFEKWINGQTGNDFIDANMLELKLSGFMSNRGRQNVASYLCHNLKLDWRYGASYFEQQLIDYDVCSNWGNWAYIAGVGNDPRENRVFNIEKQANDYDKNKLFRNLWLNKM
jgi:deoxyribodipyrimidine photo-lyase